MSYIVSTSILGIQTFVTRFDPSEDQKSSEPTGRSMAYCTRSLQRNHERNATLSDRSSQSHNERPPRMLNDEHAHTSLTDESPQPK